MLSERGAGAIAVELDFDPAISDGEITTPVVRDPSIAPSLPAPELPASGGPNVFDFVLAGSEVIRAGAVEALRHLADRSGLGVLNVFTAKGLFRWDSPYHLGTAGLQLHDFALAGLAPDRPILAVGVGLDECPVPILRDAGLSPDGPWPVTRVATDRLESLGDLVRAPHDGPPVLGDLYQRLSAVAQPLYLVEDVPLNPARAAADIGESLPEGGVVSLEPGTAGWWVARTLPTTQLGSVRVPAAGRPGLAVAAAWLAAIEGRPAVAVVEAPLAPVHRELIEHAARLAPISPSRCGAPRVTSRPPTSTANDCVPRSRSRVSPSWQSRSPSAPPPSSWSTRRARWRRGVRDDRWSASRHSHPRSVDRRDRASRVPRSSPTRARR